MSEPSPEQPGAPSTPMRRTMDRAASLLSPFGQEVGTAPRSQAGVPMEPVAPKLLALARPGAIRVVTAMPQPTFDGAVALIVGRDLDLRGASSPAGGWLTLGSGQDIQFSVYGTTLFGVGQNAAAREAWQKAARTFEDIDHEVFAGTIDLIDVNRLRAAADAVDARASTLTTGIEDMTRWTRPDVAGAGNAAAALSARLSDLGERLTIVRDQLTTPAPPVSATLRDAAEALSEFARQLSYIWWESNTVLLGAPDDAIQAITTNIKNYLMAGGLLGSPEAPQDTDRAAAVEQARAALVTYDSDAGGGLLPGMDPIAGDLTQQPVWDAANASITKRISTELDKLDAVAATQTEKLAQKYQAVTDRLKAAPKFLTRVEAPRIDKLAPLAAGEEPRGSS